MRAMAVARRAAIMVALAAKRLECWFVDHDWRTNRARTRRWCLHCGAYQEGDFE